MKRNSRRRRSAATLVAFSAYLLATTSAAADTDGTYGRLDGDVDLSIGAGCSFARGGPSATAIARVIYLGTAGLYAAYTDSFGADRPIARSASLGVSLRPLFLPRWGDDLERGPAALDLAIDALTFDAGVLLATRTTATSRPIPGLQIALGTELPLIGRAQGPWIGLRGALQWSPDDLAYGADAGQPRAAAFVTLGWHAIVDAGLVDAGDRLLH
jgi:hypothetical protein